MISLNSRSSGWPFSAAGRLMSISVSNRENFHEMTKNASRRIITSISGAI